MTGGAIRLYSVGPNHPFPREALISRVPKEHDGSNPDDVLSVCRSTRGSCVSLLESAAAPQSLLRVTVQQREIHMVPGIRKTVAAERCVCRKGWLLK